MGTYRGTKQDYYRNELQPIVCSRLLNAAEQKGLGHLIFE